MCVNYLLNSIDFLHYFLYYLWIYFCFLNMLGKILTKILTICVMQLLLKFVITILGGVFESSWWWFMTWQFSWPFWVKRLSQLKIKFWLGPSVETRVPEPFIIIAPYYLPKGWKQERLKLFWFAWLSSFYYQKKAVIFWNGNLAIPL